jgi:hypothetical protein
VSNVPDDWGSWYRKCECCGYRAHGSEGYICDCSLGVCNRSGCPYAPSQSCDDVSEDSDEADEAHDGDGE